MTDKEKTVQTTTRIPETETEKTQIYTQQQHNVQLLYMFVYLRSQYND